jgi:hypothetical protein
MSKKPSHATVPLTPVRGLRILEVCALRCFLSFLNTFGTYCRQNQSNPAYEIKANEDLYKHGLYVLAAIKVSQEPLITILLIINNIVAR